MATLVTIPTGVQNRRGSDGSGFAIGKQTASGVALNRVNYTSTAGTDAVGDGFPAGRPIRFFLDDGGYGPITLTTSANTGADAVFAVTGRDADGNVETDSITITSGAATATGTVSFAGRYLITVTPPAALNPTTLTWGASVTTVSNSVTNGMIPILFPVSNLDMNENANIEDSDLISAIGSATPPDIGQYSGQMNFTTGTVDRRIAVSVRRYLQQSQRHQRRLPLKMPMVARRSIRQWLLL